MIVDMDLTRVLETLEPVQQQAVALVYFEGRSTHEAARVLSVDTVVVAAALAQTFRRVAQWVMGEAGDRASVAQVPMA